jgi:PAS domain S-box-containing protein
MERPPVERTIGPVLVFDPDPDRRARLERALACAGETVVTAESAQAVDVIVAVAEAADAVASIRNRRPHRPPALVWLGEAPSDAVTLSPNLLDHEAAAVVALALRAARAERDRARLAAAGAVLADVGREVLASAPNEEALRRIAEAAVALTGSTAAGTLLALGDRGAPALLGLAGEPPELAGRMIADVDALALPALSAPLVRQAVGAQWDEAVAAMRLPERWRCFRAGISLPLTVAGHHLGTLAVWRKEERAFDHLEQQVLRSLATIAALAFANRDLTSRSDRLRWEGRTLREQMSDAVLVLDAEQRVVDANPAYERLYGLRGDEIAGRSVADLPVRYFDETGAPVSDPVPSGNDYQFASGDRTGWVSISSTPIRDPDGNVVGYLSVQRDVTAQKEANQLRLRNETLRALEQMAAGIAHDLNNTLALILGSSEIAANELRESQPRLVDLEESVLAIRQAALDAAQMIRRLHDFARERPPAELTAVDLAELLREVATVTRPRWLTDAQRRGTQIILEVHTETLPPIAGDASELRDALTNLIFNAVDALPNGGRIVLSAERQGDVAVVRVSDTGIGMSEAVRRRIFEPYFTTKGERGSGIGMPMVYAVVKRHRGEIEVESELGRGTTVTIRLPIGAPLPERPAAPAVDSRAGYLLVLDDEPGIATMMARMLRRDGHTVVALTNPQEALAAIERERFDLVVTDLGMPAVSGWEIAAAAKRRDPTTRVVVATGWGTDLDPDPAASASVDAVLPKPFQFQRLRELVRAVLAGEPAP